MFFREWTWAACKRFLSASYRTAYGVGVFLSLIVGSISIFTSYKTIENIRRSERQYVEEGYSRYEGSFALAIHTVGEANNKPYEIGQSTALAYLAFH